MLIVHGSMCVFAQLCLTLCHPMSCDSPGSHFTIFLQESDLSTWVYSITWLLIPRLCCMLYGVGSHRNLLWLCLSLRLDWLSRLTPVDHSVMIQSISVAIESPPPSSDLKLGSLHFRYTIIGVSPLSSLIFRTQKRGEILKTIQYTEQSKQTKQCLPWNRMLTLACM